MTEFISIQIRCVLWPMETIINNNASPDLMCVASLSHSSRLVQYTITLSQEARLPPSPSIDTRARSRSPSRDTVRVRLG